MNAHQRVVGELERLVFEELEPGAPLPSAADLAEELQVSRLTVREAVKSLQARGLVNVQHGRRPVVAALSAIAVEDFFAVSVRRDPRSMMDLLEVRKALEVQIASLAARRGNRTAASAMDAALTAMRESVDDPEAFHAADVRFHESLSAASGNRILNFLVEAMASPLRASRHHSRRGDIDRGRTLDEVVDEHARIRDAVVRGDAEGAAEAMRFHLDQTERSLRAALMVNQETPE